MSGVKSSTPMSKSESTPKKVLPADDEPTPEKVREEAADPPPVVSGASKDKEDPTAAPPVSQEIAAVKATLDMMQERLTNLETAKAETANTGCKCAIA